MTIVTQDNDLINYSAVKLITSVEGTYTNDDGTESTTAFSILAFDFNTEISDDIDDAADSAVQLGIFTDSRICDEVMTNLIDCIAHGSAVFKVPQPDGSLT